MVIWHAQRKRKTSGSLYRRMRDKRKFELGKNPTLTKISEKPKVRKIRIRGGNEKLRAYRLGFANVLDPKTKKYQRVEIKKVVENRANRHFARMNVMTKGAIIETKIGKARVTNRPGQEGIINAVLVV